MYGYGYRFAGSGSGLVGFQKSECSYYMDEVNNYIDVGDAGKSTIKGANKTWSIRTLYKPLTGASNVMPLFSIWDGTSNDRVLYINGNQTTNLIKANFSSSGSSNDGNWTSTGTINLDAWNDFIITYDSGTVVCYLNGSSFAGTSTTIPSTLYNGLNTANSLIGSINNGTGAVAGTSYYNMLSITSDIITSGEASDLWNGGEPKIASTIIDNVVEEWIYDNDTFGGTNFTVLSNVSATNGTTSGVGSGDKDCNENPY